MSEDDERGRGVLSESDRRYLKEPEDFDRQGRYQRREKIPERITNSVLDLSLLLDEQPTELIEETVADVDDENLQRAAAFLHGLRDKDEIVVEKRITAPATEDGIEYETRIKTDD
jgi:hypothetical protein